MAFEKFKKLYELQKKAKQVQRDLRDLLIETKSTDGKIKIVLNGEFKVEEVAVDEEYLRSGQKEEFEALLKKVLQDAISKTQKVVAERAKEVMGEIGFPGI
jgi:DNA-binding YbaB/EbfC family protein